MSETSGRAVGLGERGISEKLRLFVSEMPLERVSILDFMTRVAEETPVGAHILDLGAGDAPYRELFDHADYRTNDWTESAHVGGRRADVVAPASDVPLEPETLDLVLCTQVLEHVPEPALVLRECWRILRHGGRLALTVPLAGELHELPHDYYRYTGPGLEHLLQAAGFAHIQIAPRSDSLTTLAQLMLNVSYTLGTRADGLSGRREATCDLLRQLAEQLADLAPLDVAWTLPLGYCASALRP